MHPNENELLDQIKEAAHKASTRLSQPQNAVDQPVRERADGGVDVLRIVGGGSKNFYGAPLLGAPLFTQGLNAVVSYEPSELYITAKAGTPLKDIEDALAEKGQYLPFEAPNFNGSATLGGVISSGLSGPARASSGSARDYVLGIKMINGRGEQLVFGGQVMKNVAGYDVSRVLCGAWGTLGLLTEVSLKVLPQALAEKTILLKLSQQRAIELLNTWGATALALNASVWHSQALSAFSDSFSADLNKNEGILAIRLRGALAAVHSGEQSVLSQCAKLGIAAQTQEGAETQDFWNAHKNQTHPFFKEPRSPQDCLWRLSVPQKAPVLEIEGVDAATGQCTEWNAAQRWLWAPSERSAQIKACALAAGGHATLWRVSSAHGEKDKSVGVFTKLSDVQRKIQKALQQQFDPWGLFDSGRLEI
jgi:glycolate oxidase FAD binding subunit